mmetsp:Transcript_20666/g.57624  ORF Transcript_20666/g.57624 Transcript_20666/m.57624 type:complete len:454 (+) Transcript_20666:35-1396(+)
MAAIPRTSVPCASTPTSPHRCVLGLSCPIEARLGIESPWERFRVGARHTPVLRAGVVHCRGGALASWQRNLVKSVGHILSKSIAVLRVSLISGLGILLKRRRRPVHQGSLRTDVEFSTPSYCDAAERIAAEALPCRVLAFYAVQGIPWPAEEASKHRAWCRAHAIVGRVWVCGGGINAQVSGTRGACENYARFAAARLQRSGEGAAPLLCKLDPVSEPTFPSLRVKAKKLVSIGPELVLDAARAPKDQGEELEPHEWAARMQELADGAPGRLLDIRNTYEWDLGRFAGAPRPPCEQMSKATPEAYGLSEADKDRPVMIYCTGGIRCEFFGAALRKRGFRHVFRLRGGVQHYGNTLERPEGWEGRLFVFDGRNSVPVGAKGQAPMRARCAACGAMNAEEFWNCANIACNRRLVTCRTCMLAAEQGCCCAACATAIQSSTQVGGTTVGGAAGLGA